MNSLIILIAFFITSLSILAFVNERVMNSLVLNLSSTKTIYQPWKFLTYGLVHVDFFHLSCNIFTFIVFSNRLLTNYSIYHTIGIFLIGVIVPSTIGYTLSLLKRKNWIIAGASGGCYSLLAVSVMVNSKTPSSFFGYDMTGDCILLAIFVIDYLALNSSVWHFGHFVGALAGLTYMHLLGDPIVLPALDYLIHKWSTYVLAII